LRPRAWIEIGALKTNTWALIHRNAHVFILATKPGVSRKKFGDNKNAKMGRFILAFYSYASFWASWASFWASFWRFILMFD